MFRLHGAVANDKLIHTQLAKRGEPKMPCDTRRKPGQSLDQRKAEITDFVKRLSAYLTAGKSKAVVGPTGAIAFTGIDSERADAGMTDNCAYRRIMQSGSTAAKLALQKAIALSGKAVSAQAIAHGHHSHDGGNTWHTHKG
jgi:hypothetical protein